MSEVRTIDGFGNNLENPTWGKANEKLLRNTPAAYEGLSGPSGSDRPNPKSISDIVCTQEKSIKNDRDLSDYMWAWGQFLDHELDLSPEELNEELPIPLPDGGHIDFARSIYDRTTGTSLDNPREQVNVISSFIDAGNVYGTNVARAAALRAFDGNGKLKEDNGFLPRNPGGLPNAPSSSPHFFVGGDIRVNEHVVLACMHTLFVREHNRLCDELKKDPRFIPDEKPSMHSYKKASGKGQLDEQIYQHARRIVSGIMQVITYKEFLPALLGKEGIRPYSGYNQFVNPTICNEFSTVAYRVGHSMLSPEVQRTGIGAIKFEKTFFQPHLVTQYGIDPYLAGAATQRMQKIDAKAINAIRLELFTMADTPKGVPPITPLIDLAALNLQRGRDHGLPDYNTCRKAYGLARKDSFSDITSDKETQRRLKKAYKDNMDHIDPWIGGLAEDHHHDAVVGEFFFHVLKDQFERIRDGDRFWYENDLCLTDEEREDIRETTLVIVIERNTNVRNLQKNVFIVGAEPKIIGQPPTLPPSSGSSGPTPKKKKSSKRKKVTKSASKKKSAKKSTRKRSSRR